MTTKTYQEMSNQELVAEYVRLGGTAPASGKFRDKATGIKAIEALGPVQFERSPIPGEGVRLGVDFGEPAGVLIDPNDTLEECAERRGVDFNLDYRELESRIITAPNRAVRGVFEDAAGAGRARGTIEFISTPRAPGGVSARFRFYRVRNKRRPSHHAPSKEAFQALKLARRARRRAVSAWARESAR